MRTTIPEPELYDILFLDIETVSQYEHLADAPAPYRALWERKATYLATADETAASLYDRSAIYAEFGRVVCISLGYFHRKPEIGETLRVSVFAGNEQNVLAEFCSALEAFRSLHERVYLCAHNGKEFDFPYIARRLLVQNMVLPAELRVAGLRALEIWRLQALRIARSTCLHLRDLRTSGGHGRQQGTQCFLRRRRSAQNSNLLSARYGYMCTTLP